MLVGGAGVSARLGGRLDRWVRPVAGVAVLAVLGWLVAVAVVAGPPAVAGVATMALVASAAVILSVLRWRVGAYCLLAWLVLEDLPRKFLGNNMALYFGKDLLAVSVYCGLFLSRGRSAFQGRLPRFVMLLMVFVAWGVTGVFNPNSPSVLYGLLGMKLYFFYVPLLLAGYELIRDRRDLERFLRFSLLLAIGVAIVGIVQAVANPAFLNPATVPEQLNLLQTARSSPVSGRLVTRPSSVFVSTGRFGAYALLMLLLGLGGAVLKGDKSRMTRRIAAVSVAFMVPTIFLVGSRAGVLYASATFFLSVASYLWGRSRRQLGSSHTTHLGMRAAVVGGLALVAVAVLFPEAVSSRWALYYETIAPWSPASELAYRTQQYPLAEFVKAFYYPHWLIGQGIGTASLGGQYLMSVFGVSRPEALVESGYGALVVEMGVVGLMLWLAWTVALTIAAWKTLCRLRGTNFFGLGFSVLLFTFLLLFAFTYGGLQPYQNFILNANLWLLLGVLFRLPRLADRSSDGGLTDD